MRGRLGPLKLLRMLRSARRPSRVGLLGIAVRPQFRGRRIGATLAASLYRNLEAIGLRQSSYYPVNDSNVQSRELAESLGGEGRILFHCFDKTSRRRTYRGDSGAKLHSEQLFQPLERPVGAPVQHGGHADGLRALAVLDEVVHEHALLRFEADSLRSEAKISGCGL